MVNEEIVQDRAPDLNSYGRWARGIDIRAAADARRGASATVGGAQDRGASWGEGAAAAVKPLSPPGGEQLVVAGVLGC